MTNTTVRPYMAALFLALLFFASCAKEEKEYLGLDLQSEDELLNVFITDTASLIMHTVPGDSSRTSLPQSTLLLGEINDPVFGTMNSSIYSQFRISTLSPDFGTNFVCDSIVLALEFISSDSLYGNSSQALTFSVEEINTVEDEEFSADSVYYSDNGEDIPSTGLELMRPGFESLIPGDGLTIVGGDTLDGQLRLHLDPAFAESKFVTGPMGDELADMDAFLSYFKGLKISAHVSNPGEVGNMSSINANASATKMTMYYRSDGEDMITDTAEVDFFMNALSQRFLSFNLDHSAGMGAVQTAFNNPLIGEQDLFIQAMTGANIEVDIPYLMDFADSSDIAINKAELVLEVNTVNGQDEEQFPFPNRLFGVFTNSEGDITSIPDTFEGETHSDGYYDQDDGEYRINITRFVQQVLTGEIENPQLKLLPVNNTATASFVQLYGPENLMGPAKLEITFTKY